MKLRVPEMGISVTERQFDPTSVWRGRTNEADANGKRR